MCEYCNKKINVCNRAYRGLLSLGRSVQPSNNLDTVTIPKLQYDEMKKKCKLYDSQYYSRPHHYKF